jgi:hypothetical protein
MQGRGSELNERSVIRKIRVEFDDLVSHMRPGKVLILGARNIPGDERW